MKQIAIGMRALAAFVVMATISARTLRAEDILEAAKHQSGFEFGETGGLKGRGGFSTVSAFSEGIGRPALTAGKLDVKAVKGGHEVASPCDSSGSEGGTDCVGDRKALSAYRKEARKEALVLGGVLLAGIAALAGVIGAAVLVGGALGPLAGIVTFFGLCLAIPVVFGGRNDDI